MANEAFEMNGEQLAKLAAATPDAGILALTRPPAACYECARDAGVPFPATHTSTLCALHYAATTEENRRIIMQTTTRQTSPFEAQTTDQREEALRNLADAMSGIEKALRFAARIQDTDAPLAGAIWNSASRTQRYIVASMEELRETPVAQASAA